MQAALISLSPSRHFLIHTDMLHTMTSESLVGPTASALLGHGGVRGTVYAIGVVGILASCSRAHVLELGIESLLSNIPLAVLCLWLAIEALAPGTFTTTGTSAACEVTSHSHSTTLPDALLVFLFCYGSAEFVLLNVPADVAPKKVPAYAMRVSVIGNGLTLLLYATVGTLGSLAMGCNVRNDILANFDRGLGAWVLHLLNFLSILLSLPVFVVTCRQYVSSLLWPHLPSGAERDSVWFRVTASAVTIGVAGLSSALVPVLSDMIAVVCSFTDSLLMLVFPATMWLWLWLRGVIAPGATRSSRTVLVGGVCVLLIATGVVLTATKLRDLL